LLQLQTARDTLISGFEHICSHESQIQISITEKEFIYSPREMEVIQAERITWYYKWTLEKGSNIHLGI
jgi:hypothetical protein